MTENEAKISTIAEDYKAVLHEAKSMGCNDIRALYHIPIKNMELIVQALEEIQQYHAIGTVEECRAAVEKQMARKPLIGTNMMTKTKYKVCPFCGGKAKINLFLGNYYVTCGNYNCPGAIYLCSGMKKKEAIEVWNRRANNAAD